MGVVEEIAFIKARSLQELLPQLIKGSIYVRAIRDTIEVKITTSELGSYGWRFHDVACVDLTSFDMADRIAEEYRKLIRDRFFR